jgi:hypothetical protein
MMSLIAVLGLAVLVGLVFIALLLAAVLAYLKLGKPSLPGPALFSTGKRFKQQREKVRASKVYMIYSQLSTFLQMFVEVLQECDSLSADFEGWLVTADPMVIKQLMNRKEHTAKRSRLYQVSK